MLGSALMPKPRSKGPTVGLPKGVVSLLLSLVCFTFTTSHVEATTRLWTQRTGVSYTNENTVEGLEYALGLGAVGAEFDIWQTGTSPAHPNGEIVLQHDRFVDAHTDYTELTGQTNGDISQLSFEVIRSLNAGANPSMFAPLQESWSFFSPIKIPTLEEILLSFKANDADAMFHFKGHVGEEIRSGYVDPADVAAVLQQTNFPLDKRYLWTPVDSLAQDYVAEIPGMRVIYQGAVNSSNPDWNALHTLGIKAIHVRDSQLTEAFIDGMHAEGLEAFMFTPQLPVFINAVRLGVDIVLTHRIFEYKPYLESLQSIEQGDFNGDGFVDGADFLAWQSGDLLAPLTSADLTLDASDLANWEANFGTTIASLATVPEPSSMALLVTTLVSVLCTRKR